MVAAVKRTFLVLSLGAGFLWLVASVMMFSDVDTWQSFQPAWVAFCVSLALLGTAVIVIWKTR